jgi:hypothetical protein
MCHVQHDIANKVVRTKCIPCKKPKIDPSFSLKPPEDSDTKLGVTDYLGRTFTMPKSMGPARQVSEIFVQFFPCLLSAQCPD